MGNSNQIELTRLYEEATFVILMAYDHHKRSKVMMENGRMKTAGEHCKVVQQNAEKLLATITKVIEGLEEVSSLAQREWISKNQVNPEMMRKY
jgi:hypothetical protein